MLALTVVLPALVVPPPAPLIVVGPGSTDVQFLVSKLAAAAGYRVQCVTRAADIPLAERLMYGGAEPVGEPPRFSVQNSQIASALGSAEAMVLCVAGGKVPPSTSGIATMMPYAPRLKRIALLSAIGGSTGATGGLGEGGLIRSCEAEVAATATAAGVEVSTVRVGVLKGGGAAEQPTGLAADAFYASLCAGGYPTPSSICAKAYDKQTLGVAVSGGDGVEARNAALRSSTRTSAKRARSPLFEPIATATARSTSAPPPVTNHVRCAACADEVSRINAAGALLAVLRHDGPLEVSLSAEAGDAPPTDERWDQMLAALSAST